MTGERCAVGRLTPGETAEEAHGLTLHPIAPTLEDSPLLGCDTNHSYLTCAATVEAYD